MGKKIPGFSLGRQEKKKEKKKQERNEKIRVVSWVIQQGNTEEAIFLSKSLRIKLVEIK